VNSYGVSFTPAGAAKLYISNTTITDNGSGNTGGGINITPASPGSARVVMTNVRVRNNAQDGVRASSATGSVNLVIEGSELSGNIQGLAVLGGPSVVLAMVNNSTIANNSVIGIVSTNNAITRVDNTSITGNATGISAQAPSQIISYGFNRLAGNPVVGAANDGAFTSVVSHN
jgi:hypothetical protein